MRHYSSTIASSAYKSPQGKGWKKHSAAPEMFLQLQFASDQGKLVDPSDIPAAHIATGGCPEEDMPSRKYMTHVEVKQCPHVLEEIEQETTIATENFHLQLNIPQLGTNSSLKSSDCPPSPGGVLEVVCAAPKMIPKLKGPQHEDDEGPEKPSEEEMDQLMNNKSSYDQPPPPPPLEDPVPLTSRNSIVGSDSGSVSEKSVSSASSSSAKWRLKSPKSVLDIDTENKRSSRSSKNGSPRSSPSQTSKSLRCLTPEPVLEVELTAEETEQIISASIRSLPSDLKDSRYADDKFLRRSLRMPSGYTSPTISSCRNAGLTRRRSVQGPLTGTAPPPSPRSRRRSTKALPPISSPRNGNKKGLSQSEHVKSTKSRSEQSRNSSSSGSSSGRRESSSATPRTRGRRSADSLMLKKSIMDCPTTDGGAPIKSRTGSRRQRRSIDSSIPAIRKGFQSARTLPFVADLNSDDDDEAAERVLDALLK